MMSRRIHVIGLDEQSLSHSPWGCTARASAQLSSWRLADTVIQHITLCDEPESEEFAEANMVVDICIIPQVLSSSPMLILMDP